MFGVAPVNPFYDIAHAQGLPISQGATMVKTLLYCTAIHP